MSEEKTVIEWLNELPDGYRQSAVFQCLSHKKDVECDGIDHAIIKAFLWFTSIEGREFWAELPAHRDKSEWPSYTELCDRLKIDYSSNFEKHIVGKKINGIVVKKACLSKGDRWKNFITFDIEYLDCISGTVDVDFNKGPFGSLEVSIPCDEYAVKEIPEHIESIPKFLEAGIPDDTTITPGVLYLNQGRLEKEVIDELYARLNRIKSELCSVFVNDTCYFNHSNGWVDDLMRYIEFYKRQQQ